MTRRSGLTLTEAIISIFLLVSGFIVVARCFHAALQMSAVTSTRIQAIQVAQRHLESIRSWSRRAHEPVGNLLMSAAWGGLDGVTYRPDPYDARFSVATIVSAPPFYSPCTLFEQAVASGPPAGPLDPARVPTDFTANRRQVTAVVNWGGSESVRLTTMICAPTPAVAQASGRRLASVLKKVALLALTSQVTLNRGDQGFLPALEALTPYLLAGPPILPVPIPVAQPLFSPVVDVQPPGPITLSHDQNQDFQCSLINNAISLPCRTRWSLLGPGTGTLLVAANGRSARFIHSYDDNGLLSYADNLTCQIEVTAIYRGLIVKGRSGVISLQP